MPESSTTLPPSQPRTIVLKFGGSVLLDQHRLRIAVHEIYRWRRDGWRVIAVVSALAGWTEELIARCDALCPGGDDRARAAVIAGGESESASLLGVHLDRAGIPAAVLTPAAARLIAHGPPLNADPVSIDTKPIARALGEHGVMVFPGFTAIDERGATVTLGRGGSDLTAVFLAHRLRADRCRLIKDVDALYESDPATTSPPPRRFSRASYEDALNTDGSILQHKAVRYAQKHGIDFQLARFNAVRPTTIGSGATEYDDAPDRPTPLSIAVCGLGTVGRGVIELAAQLPDHFRLAGGACRSPEKHADLESALGNITTDAPTLARSGADLVLELIGGTDTARAIVTDALQNGSHVITANKALIAKHGSELCSLADEHGVSLRYSASVGGSVPILESLASANAIGITGVLNGTANFVLGALEAGRSLDEAVRDAQDRGFAEADPTRDLDGRDALDKLLVIAQTLGRPIDPDQRSTASINDWLANAGQPAFPARQIATLDPSGASVCVQSVSSDSTLGQLTNEWNAAVITHADGSDTTLRGKGAGRWPTSESVFADLLQLSREIAASTPAPNTAPPKEVAYG